MPSLKDVKRKIDAVKKTKQITKAMNMVASAKLRGDLAGKADASAHPLLEVRSEIKTTGIILCTSDRGLCGSFNVNIISKALKLARVKAAEGKTVKFYCIGKKGADAVRKSEFEIVMQLRDAMNSFDFSLANQVGLEVIDAYLTGDLDEVHVAYGTFVSMAKQIPTTKSILPIGAHEESQAQVEAAAAAGPGGSGEYTYEPDVEGLLAELLPRFIKVQIYRGLLDTSASEHAARMTAMDNATRACDDMTNQLTLLYNKTRQAAITRELMDIVGGAEALKG